MSYFLSPIYLLLFGLFNAAACWLSFSRQFTVSLEMPTSKFKVDNIWIERSCCIFDGFCFVSLMVLLFKIISDPQSDDNNIFVAMSIILIGLVGLFPYFLSMILLGSWFQGKRLKLALRVMLLGLVLYVVALASIYEVLIGITL